jgi:hypothetical protein
VYSSFFACSHLPLFSTHHTRALIFQMQGSLDYLHSELDKASKKVRKIQSIIAMMNDLHQEDSKAKKAKTGGGLEIFGLGLGSGRGGGAVSSLCCSEDEEDAPPPLFKPRARRAERERESAPSPPARFGASSSLSFGLSSPRGASAAAAAASLRPPQVFRSDRKRTREDAPPPNDEDDEDN